jgi:hypothetical protein
MNLPQSFKDIPVGLFQDMQQILAQAETDHTYPHARMFELVACITGMGDTQLNALPLQEYADILQKLEWIHDLQTLSAYPLLNNIELNGTRYHVCLDMHSLTAGQFIDLTTFTKKPADNINQLHNILATLLVRPGKKYEGATHAQRAALVRQHMPVSEAYPIAVFFSAFLNASYKVIQTCLDKQLKQMHSQLSHRQKRITNAGAGILPWMPLATTTSPNGPGFWH